MSNYKVTVWGSRGSFVQTTVDKMKYGLETSCISFETEDEFFLIDCGSGIRGFDRYFYDNKLTHKKVNIFLTHYHHDHIFGLGFVKFIFDPSVQVEIFGLNDVYETLNNYFGPPYFPINMMELPNIKTRNIKAYEKIEFNDFEINTTLLQHPQHCLGYKFVTKNKTVTVITDYEYTVDNKKHIVEEFIENSDYLIIDAFSTAEDYIEGWGHSNIEEIVELVEKLNVQQCLLTHHNGNYNDDKLDQIQLDINKEHSNIKIAMVNTYFEFN